LQTVVTDPPTGPVTIAPPRRRRRAALLLGLASAGLALLAGGWVLWGRLAPRPGPTSGARLAELALTLATGPLLLRPGETKTITVRLTRTNWPGPVVVEVEGLPAGALAGPLTVPAGADEATLRLAARLEEAPGEKTTADVHVVARAGGAR